MPKIMNQDIIAKIAECAGRNYTKSATARGLELNRATVRKYWPREEAPKKGKVEQPNTKGVSSLTQDITKSYLGGLGGTTTDTFQDPHHRPLRHPSRL